MTILHLIVYNIINICGYVMLLYKKISRFFTLNQPSNKN